MPMFWLNIPIKIESNINYIGIKLYIDSVLHSYDMSVYVGLTIVCKL